MKKERFFFSELQDLPMALLSSELSVFLTQHREAGLASLIRSQAWRRNKHAPA